MKGCQTQTCGAPVFTYKSTYSVIMLTYRFIDGTIKTKKNFHLSDVPGGEGEDRLSPDDPGVVWITGVVDESQRGVESHAYLDDLVEAPVLGVSHQLRHLDKWTSHISKLIEKVVITKIQPTLK